MTMHLLVVTEGTDATIGALRLARALSQKRASTVDVLGVIPSVPPAPLGVDGSAGDPSEAEASAAFAMRDAIAGQLGGLGESVRGWPVGVRIGPAAESIAQAAREAGASLVLVAHPRERDAAVLDAEVILEMVHLSHLPVLAVPSAVTDLPRRFLVGVGAHAPTLDSLTEVLLEISDPRVIHLAHVVWEVGPSKPRETEAWKAGYVSRVAEQLEALAGELRSSTPAHVEVHVPIGDWDQGLVTLAGRLGVDLVATGSHAYGELGRAFTRSVSTAVLHGAPCSVLIVPNPHSESRLEVLGVGEVLDSEPAPSL